MKTKCYRAEFCCSSFFEFFQKKPFTPIAEIISLLGIFGWYATKQKFATIKKIGLILSLQSLLKVPFKTMTGTGRGMRPAAPSLPLQERRPEEGGARRPAAEMRQD
jgi:hypothetical protein